ncbi:MAG: hypothetical protein J7J44_02565 [Deltaproteobacteria bacterium]|nr:hypothetical protein [Deltaproteobacteria bacterium]
MRKVHVKRFTYPNVKEQDTGNYSIITKGREQVCKKCARCCKQFRWYIDESMALRAMYLDVKNVWVEEHQLGNRYVYVLVIDVIDTMTTPIEREKTDIYNEFFLWSGVIDALLKEKKEVREQ